MDNNFDTRIAGYGLIVTGLIIILMTGVSALSILNGSTRAFSYFNFDSVSISTTELVGQVANPDGSIELISSSMLNDTSNLIAHLFILGLFATLGSKVAGIGTQLVRPINVNLNGKKV